MLSLLNGTKESITTSQAWFMACAPYASGMAEMTATAAAAAAPADYTSALHILWLVNDVLFKAKSQRPEGGSTTDPGQDSISAAFKPFLPGLLRSVYGAAAGVHEKQQSVLKVVNIWSERRVFPSVMVESMVMEMMGIGPAMPAVPAVLGSGSNKNFGVNKPPPPAGPPPARPQPGIGQSAAGAAPWAPTNTGFNAPYGAAAIGPGASGYPHHQPHQAFHPQQQRQQQQQFQPPPPVHHLPWQPRPPPHFHPPPPGGPPLYNNAQHAHGGMMVPPPGAFPPQPHPAAHAMHAMHAGLAHFHPQQQQQTYNAPPMPPRPPSPPPPAEPEEPPFDPFSFPPGLIPRLVEDSLRSEAAYSPLSPLDIEKSEVPPPPKMDPYLKARVDKFYAQLADYRQGMAFSDIEVEPPRHRQFTDRAAGTAGGPVGGGGSGVGLSRGKIDDGSGGFGPSGGAGGRGLGYGNSAAQGNTNTNTNTTNNDNDAGDREDSVFGTYRLMRSQGYHAGIGRSGDGKSSRR